MPSGLRQDLEAQQIIDKGVHRSVILRLHFTVLAILNEPVRIPARGFPFFAVLVYFLSSLALIYHDYYLSAVSMALVFINGLFLFLIASLPELKEVRGVIKPIISTLILSLCWSKFLSN